MRPIRFELEQVAGQPHLARAADWMGERMLGDAHVAIVPVGPEGGFSADTEGQGGSYDGYGDWWMVPERAGWRAALLPDGAAWLRPAEGAGSVWQIAQAVIEPGCLFLRLSRRIGDVKP